MKKRIAVFASGFGSNLQAIMDYSGKDELNGEVVLVFSNNRNAYALERAAGRGIKNVCFSHGDYPSRESYDREILKLLDSEKIDLVVLAGYMLLVGVEIINKYKNKIINIHPALLPSFKGTHGIKEAFDYGVKVTGVTVHFVDEGLDSGPIILQEAVNIGQNDNIEKLEESIHMVEHKIYPLAVKYFCEDRLKITGRKVSIL
ncbi:MAG: phosphoribosylglycinamide formyltransferase [Actinobacteria bacterium]|nr:phosphoribosylglycinamide formyltransferase [Actinomycetota bacterium]MBM3712014.1 phosphoribosylglycinamide formyltransferase [Actinomycetota bacterium]